MKYLMKLFIFLFFFSLQAAHIHDSVMVDKLARYISVSDCALQALYAKASDVECDDIKFTSRLSFNRPLFQSFPKLANKLSHIDLGDLPTSVQRMESLGSTIGCTNLYIKRDDNTGKKMNGGIRLFGGNKIRKLEFLLAQALQLGSKTVMTIGGAGSNHALATAVCASALGLKRISILGPQENNVIVKRNLLLGKFYGADLQYFKRWRDCPAGIADLFFKVKEKDGVYPYYITVGGSSPLGAVGFVNAAFELKEQIQSGLLPEPDFIYVACGSMGTTAGLILGLKVAGLQSKVVAVRVGNSASVNKIINLAKETSLLLHEYDATFPLLEIQEDDFIFEEDFLGSGYAQPTQEAIEAMRLMKNHHGITLDGTYSGKGFSALVGHARDNLLQEKVVLFWDTFCGYNYDEITSCVDCKTLPKDLHWYVAEA